MLLTDIAQYRLFKHQLVGTGFAAPKDILAYFGAMQAQDYAMAKWAIGLRLGINEEALEQTINNAAIIRTHILRPTWHFVAAEDIRWMLMLTAPQVKQRNAVMCKKFELDSNLLNHCKAIIEQTLRDNQHLTRDKIMLELNTHGIQTDDIRSALIMMDAEQDGIVCNGMMQGKQFTYALLDERVPPTKMLSKEDALAELAKRYFQSHGPATLQDFIWWSGLTAGNAKLALELIKPSLHFFTVEQQTYWFTELANYKSLSTPSIHFLPAFDEFLISYKDRSASLTPSLNKDIITTNGIFNPSILVNGKVVGSWKRSFKKDTVHIEMNFPDSTIEAQEILNATEKYGNFVGKKVNLKV